MAATLAVSSGWMILVLPLVTILPGAVAMMSISPMQDQATAKTAMAMMVAPRSLPIGEAGVSMISNAAGRKSRSSRVRRGKAITLLSLGSIDAPGLHCRRGGALNGVHLMDGVERQMRIDRLDRWRIGGGDLVAGLHPVETGI